MSTEATDNMSKGQSYRRYREATCRRGGVDPACYDLARHFLTESDVRQSRTDEQIKEDLQSLSKVIQQAVEDWFSLNVVADGTG